MICICCELLTFDHCRVCDVPLCWPCGKDGLCGLCVRMELIQMEHRMIQYAHTLILPPALVLSEDEEWKISMSNVKTELVEIA